jgi:hypothetical protein
MAVGLSSIGPIGDAKDADKMYEEQLIHYVKGNNRGAGMGFKPRPGDAKTANALNAEATKKWMSKQEPAIENDSDIPTGGTFNADGTFIQAKKKGGKVKSSASKRADGIATKGFTKGRYM